MWITSYQDNNYPAQFAEKVARSPTVSRAVIVFWNVNDYTEFAYWEQGQQFVTFDHPQDRRGSDPDRLAAEMAETVGLVHTGEESGPAAQFYAQMLGPADRITGTHLDPGFLRRRSVMVGEVDE